MGPGARGRPHEPRGGAARRGSGRSPGGSTPVGRATTRSPRTCGSGCAARSTAWTRRSWTWSGRSSGWRTATARPSCRAPRTSSRPSRCCWPITCWRTSRCSSATGVDWPTAGGGPTSRRWARARWRARAIRSTARRPRRSSGFDGVTANSLDAVSDRDFVVEALAGHRAVHGPPVAAGRGDHLVVEPAVRLRPGGRLLLDRLVDDAEQEEPRPGRAGAGPGGAGHRLAHGNAGAAEGIAARVPARPAGGQAAAVRGGGHARGVAAASWPG